MLCRAKRQGKGEREWAKKIRLLVVDDPPFIHKAVKKALAGSDGIEIVGTAENGKICLDLVAHSIPTL